MSEYGKKPLDRVALIRELGVRVGYETRWVGEPPERKKIETDRVNRIEFPFSPEDWMAVAQRDGAHYVGGCCANMSLLQDEVNGVFRDDGWADGGTMIKIAEVARGHDGFEDFAEVDDEGFEKLVARWRQGQEKAKNGPFGPWEYFSLHLDPWFKLAVAFNAVESQLVPSSPEVPRARHPHETEEKHVVGQLANATFRMDWSDLFGSNADSPDEKDQHEAQRRLHQAKVLPLVQKVAELLNAQSWPWEGFAVVRKGTDEILSDHRGPCVYADREAAERTLGRWARWAAEEAERRSARKASGDGDEESFWEARRGEVVRVRVSPGEGVEVLR